MEQGINHVDPHLNLRIDAGIGVPYTHPSTVGVQKLY